MRSEEGRNERRGAMPTYHSLAYLLNQAELVDGFLAWDFDADTAATFFAQQV